MLLAFRAKDGRFLWQDVAPRVERGLREWLLPSTTSAPYVEGNRLYYVTAECQLRASTRRVPRWRERRSVSGGASRTGCGRHRLGARHLRPPGCVSARGHEQRGAARGRSADGLDLQRAERGPHARPVAARPEPDRGGQALGRRGLARHRRGRAGAPRPVVEPGGGRRRRAHPGALRRRRWLAALLRRGVGSRNLAIRRQSERRPLASAARRSLARLDHRRRRSSRTAASSSRWDRVPAHGNGPSFVHAISPDGLGDVTGSRLLWTSREVGRVVGTPIARDGLLYVGDLGGTIHCLDAATGAHVWKHETHEAIWGSLLLAGDRLYVGNDRRAHDRASRRTAQGSAGADRDGCAALLASGAGRRRAVSGHREPPVSHCGKASGGLTLSGVSAPHVREAGPPRRGTGRRPGLERPREDRPRTRWAARGSARTRTPSRGRPRRSTCGVRASRTHCVWFGVPQGMSLT